MMQRGGGVDLAEEPLAADGAADRRAAKTFTATRPVVLVVLGQVDGGHAAAAHRPHP